jgi:hypothetical protein
MLEIRNELHLVIFIYLLLGVLIWKMKPRIMFDNEGKMKQFGIGNKKSVFAFPIIVILLAIIIFYLFEIRMLYKANLV